MKSKIVVLCKKICRTCKHLLGCQYLQIGMLKHNHNWIACIVQLACCAVDGGREDWQSHYRTAYM